MANPKLCTELQIAAAPAVVRDQFLDFKSLALWQRPSGVIQSLKLAAEGKTGKELVPGDIMYATLGGLKMTLEVVENNETTFAWRGDWPSAWICLLGGIHYFKFLPADSSNPSSPITVFRQEEKHYGPLAGLTKLDIVVNRANDGNMALMEDLKRWIEKDS